VCSSDLDPARRKLFGDRARQLVERNRGATETTIKLLEGILANPLPAEISNIAADSAPANA